MLRLTIEGNEIELYENEPINLSYQFSNLQEINASASSFSQTFRVPLTKKNQEYFGAVNEFGLKTVTARYPSTVLKFGDQGEHLFVTFYRVSKSGQAH